MGNFPLRGPDQTCWDKVHEADLVAIRRRQSSDPFSRWLINAIIPYYHKIIGYRFKVCTSLSQLSPKTQVSLPQSTQIQPRPQISKITSTSPSSTT
jgi:hypothetical protein